MNNFTKSVAQKLSKLSDAQIEKLFSSVTSQRDTLSSIIESLSLGLIILDGNYKLLLINKAAERCLPFRVRPLPKNESSKIWELIGDERISEFLKNSFDKKKYSGGEEFSFQTSGGSVRFVQLSLSPLVKDEKLDGCILAIRDITEQRNQEILLHRMESLAGLTNLAASVAHEIKNPLGAISIHIQLLQKAIKKARESDGLLPDEKFLEKYIGVVNDEISNLNKIVMDFLFAVRPISASFELLEPNPLLQKFADFFAPEFSSKNVDVKLDLSSQNTRLMLDQKLFREVVVNLAQNSLSAIQDKFKGKKGGVFEIHSAFKDNKFVLLIKDNGAGMSEQTLSRVFEPYYTTKASGTGLGMTMVYKIIKEFSGDIQVESKEGEGSAFIISLPIPQTDKRLLTYEEKKEEAL
ncbi:MAG: PAS domain S-box protein [Treponema sp.]|nr:PAS domain S-box protein [Treponema sp.]